MKRRVNILATTLLVVLAVGVWFVASRQRTTIATIAAAVPMAPRDPAQSPVTLAATAPQPPAQGPVPSATDGPARHVARYGETVSSLATDLLGGDSKTNRDAIVNANPSLKGDPDRLLEGTAYRIPAASDVPTVVPAPVPTPAAVPEPRVEGAAPVARARPAPVLKYTATAGDTVGTLSGAFLGGDDASRQDAIIRANPSLRADPDHIVAGRSYRIPAPHGLSAAAAAAPALVMVPPTTQPDEDQLVAAGSPRVLRYTARPGDTLAVMAVKLLGSDTPGTRSSIVNSNAALKADPDRVVAGKTYWIPAPTADGQTP
jgi:hypothetical protein